jgi:hypothetical protein
MEKKKEAEAVIALERASADFASRFQALGRDMDVVAETAISTNTNYIPSPWHLTCNPPQVHGSVLAHWPHMFNLVRLFCECTVYRTIILTIH